MRVSGHELFGLRRDLSPLKGKPLRNPGQSLDEALNRIADEKVLSYVLFPAVLWGLALAEWVEQWRGMPRSPGLYAIFAAGLTVWSVWRLRGLLRVVSDAKLGRDGERAVGQFLEGLRVSGARVFHDVPAEGFNLDHVVISEHGIFAIETKTWRKPRPDARISARAGQIYRDGVPFTPNPLIQATAEADWLRKMLQESTGKSFAVRAVLAFPGWFVEPIDDETKRQAWVLEPKALPAFIECEQATVSSSDVALAAYHLSRYVRTID